jgi:hypothetical protein
MNGQALLKRFNAANSRKSLWVDTLQQAYQYALPQREEFYENMREGQKKNEEVYDSTAINGLQKYASRMQATLMPPWRKWAKLAPGQEVPDSDKQAVMEGLEKATDILFTAFNHSPLSTQAHEAILECGVSTGALLFQEGDPEQPFDIVAVPLSQIVPEEGPDGTIETVFREWDVPGRLIERKWPDAKIPTSQAQSIESKPDSKVKIIEGTIYNPDTKKYDYKVMIKQGMEIIVEREEDVSPWIVFRTAVMPGEILGRGPIMQALPDILTANKVVEFTLRRAAIDIGGIYTHVSDGSINPYTIQLVPNSIIPVGSNNNENPTLRRLETGGGIDVSQIVLADLRANINDALFNNQLGPVEGPTKSATEISIRQQDLVQTAGATFGRLQTELLEKLVRRGVYILQRLGKMPDFKVDGKEVTLRYESPLARAQDAEEIQNIVRWMEMSSMTGPQIFMGTTKVEEIPAKLGELLGVPADLKRPEADKEQLLQMVAELIAQSQMPEAQ